MLASAIIDINCENHVRDFLNFSRTLNLHGYGHFITKKRAHMSICKANKMHCTWWFLQLFAEHRIILSWPKSKITNVTQEFDECLSVPKALCFFKILLKVGIVLPFDMFEQRLLIQKYLTKTKIFFKINWKAD